MDKMLFAQITGGGSLLINHEDIWIQAGVSVSKSGSVMSLGAASLALLPPPHLETVAFPFLPAPLRGRT